jgi:hypothetical protein
LSSPQRISSSPWLRYGKECMHASQSRPYWDTGRPAIVMNQPGSCHIWKTWSIWREHLTQEE